MSNTIYNVQDKVVTTTKTIKSFQIREIRVDVFKTATIHIICFDSDNHPIECRTIVLTEQEYNDWGLDDTYLLNLICTKLELALISS